MSRYRGHLLGMTVISGIMFLAFLIGFCLYFVNLPLALFGLRQSYTGITMNGIIFLIGSGCVLAFGLVQIRTDNNPYPQWAVENDPDYQQLVSDPAMHLSDIRVISKKLADTGNRYLMYFIALEGVILLALISMGNRILTLPMTQPEWMLAVVVPGIIIGILPFLWLDARYRETITELKKYSPYQFALIRFVTLRFSYEPGFSSYALTESMIFLILVFVSGTMVFGDGRFIDYIAVLGLAALYIQYYVFSLNE
jgi:hypothetical protein